MIFEIIGNSAGFFEVIMLYVLINAFFERKYENKPIYYIWIIMQYLIMIIANHINSTVGVVMLFGLIFEFLAIKILYDGHIHKILFWIVAYTSIIALADSIVYILITYIIMIDVNGAFEYGLINSVSTIISKIILWVIIMRLKLMFGRKTGYEGNKSFVPLLVVPLVSICAMFLILDYVDNVTLRERNNTLIYITIVGMFIMNIVVFYMYERLHEMSVVKQEISLMEQQLIYQRKYFSQLEENYQQIRGIKHDINRHITLINTLAKKEEYDKIIDYTSELGVTTENITEIVHTGNVILDAVINEKCCIARKSEINFQFEVEKIEENVINPTSLCIVVSNVLDNAIEACEKIKNRKKPMIQFKLYMQKNNLILSVENDAEEIKVEKGNILTSKVDKNSHGIGLKNVERVIKENNGYYEIGYEKGKFIFVSRIPSNWKAY